MSKPYVVQLWIRPVAEECTQPWCDEAHGRAKPLTPKATWEVRFYQNVSRLETWMDEGVPLDEIGERAWNETCQEQEEVGLVAHGLQWLCDAHLSRLIGFYGLEPVLLPMVFAQVRQAQCSFAVVADREDATTFLVSGLPLRVADADLFALLDEQTGDILWNTEAPLAGD